MATGTPPPRRPAPAGIWTPQHPAAGAAGRAATAAMRLGRLLGRGCAADPGDDRTGDGAGEAAGADSPGDR